ATEEFSQSAARSDEQEWVPRRKRRSPAHRWPHLQFQPRRERCSCHGTRAIFSLRPEAPEPSLISVRPGLETLRLSAQCPPCAVPAREAIETGLAFSRPKACLRPATRRSATPKVPTIVAPVGRSRVYESATPPADTSAPIVH